MDEKKNWVIKDDEEAERAYLKLISHEIDSEDYVNNCKSQISYYEKRIEQEKQRIDRIKSFYAVKLKEYFDSLNVKKRRLPSIVLEYRKQRPECTWKEETVVEFLKENSMQEYLRIKTYPAKDKLKKIIKIINGKPVLPDGQILEGLQIIEREPMFSIK